MTEIPARPGKAAAHIREPVVAADMQDMQIGEPHRRQAVDQEAIEIVVGLALSDATGWNPRRQTDCSAFRPDRIGYGGTFVANMGRIAVAALNFGVGAILAILPKPIKASMVFIMKASQAWIKTKCRKS